MQRLKSYSSVLFPFLLLAPARVAATASFGPPIPILRRNNDRRGAEWPAADRRVTGADTAAVTMQIRAKSARRPGAIWRTSGVLFRNLLAPAPPLLSSSSPSAHISYLSLSSAAATSCACSLLISVCSMNPILQSAVGALGFLWGKGEDL